MIERLSRGAPAKSDIDSAELRLVLDSTGEAIYRIDMVGNCTFCNAACLRLLGYKDPVELIGKNMHNLVHHTRPDGTP
jgi:PAS domain S-box-containing protein